VTTFGFLHTGDVHVAVFNSLVSELAPDDRALHVVDPSLLADARERHGVDRDLKRRIARHLEKLAGDGARRVVCTCSTIGGPAEDVGVEVGVAVLRVDRPMARRAVDSGERIAIVAALESTLGPTRALLQATADAAGRTVHILDAPCLGAWTHWETGDVDRYLASLAAHIETLDDTVDVIVLAQASMAPVAHLVDIHTPVLSSPRLAVMDLVEHKFN
jgi:hypothetical protein